MKILIIHPSDPSTDFLSDIYSDLGKYSDIMVIRNVVSKSYIKNAIKHSDKIIFLGHGTERGLINIKGHSVIDSSLVYLLREKECVYIWCHANEFKSKYNLKGFSTGMFISEEAEADFYKVKYKGDDINRSNLLFTSVIKENIKYYISGNSDDLYDKVIENYKGSSDVINYNVERLKNKV